MPVISEVFKKPTVKSVSFQITFSDLFLIEKIIGDFQAKIIDQFPDSSLMYRNRFFFIEKHGKLDLTDLEKIPEDESKEKVWQFKSKNGIEINVSLNSVSIISKLHKSYNNKESELRFRDVIQSVSDKFFALVPIVTLKRIGLRYIDECPLPDVKHMDNTSFREWYNTTFDLNQFVLGHTKELATISVFTEDNCIINYIERLMKDKDTYHYILDFDGSAENIDKSQYLEKTDKIHDLISIRYDNIIKEPVREIMRG